MTDEERLELTQGDGLCDDPACGHVEKDHHPGSGLCKRCDCVGFMDEDGGEA